MDSTDSVVAFTYTHIHMSHTHTRVSSPACVQIHIHWHPKSCAHKFQHGTLVQSCCLLLHKLYAELLPLCHIVVVVAVTTAVIILFFYYRLRCRHYSCTSTGVKVTAIAALVRVPLGYHHWTCACQISSRRWCCLDQKPSGARAFFCNDLAPSNARC